MRSQAEIDTLFLQRCGELLKRLQNRTHLGAADLAGVVCQLIGDQPSLADAANTSQVSLNFEARPMSRPTFMINAAHSSTEGFSPHLKPGGPFETLSLNQFLDCAVMYIGGRPVSVRTILDARPDRLVGRHEDPRQVAQDGGSSVSASALLPEAIDPQLKNRQIYAIATVVFCALEPLRVEVKARRPQ